MNGPGLVAVTGATGFLGRHLVAALAAKGARLRLLVRRDPGPGFWPGLQPEIVTGGLDDAQALAMLVKGADAVVHAAALTKAPGRAAFHKTNGEGARALAQAARDLAPDARFLLVSSLAARAPHLSDYAASKRAGEEAARAVYGDAPQLLTIVRPPAIYGPGDREGLAIFKAAAGPLVPLFGGGRMAVVHVADAAGAIARLALGEAAPGVWALTDANPAGYTLADILGEAGRALGRRPRFLPLPGAVLIAAGAASGWWGKLSGRAPLFTAGKAREILHPDWTVTPGEALPVSVYRPGIGLAEGMTETAAWYRQAGWLDRRAP